MLPADFKKYFWDADFEKLDPRLHKKYILERILELGDEKAGTWLKKKFSAADILAVLPNNRKISPKSSNYWTLILKR